MKMMLKDRFVKIMLVLIAILLLFSLSSLKPYSLIAPEEAGARSPQDLAFRGNGVGIACSDGGQYVYAASNSGVFRSTDFGKRGSWEKVID
jgi:hypothetical protein